MAVVKLEGVWYAYPDTPVAHALVVRGEQCFVPDGDGWKQVSPEEMKHYLLQDNTGVDAGVGVRAVHVMALAALSLDEIRVLGLET